MDIREQDTGKDRAMSTTYTITITKDVEDTDDGRAIVMGYVVTLADEEGNEVDYAVSATEWGAREVADEMDTEEQGRGHHVEVVWS